jgi:hypothetical protein
MPALAQVRMIPDKSLGLADIFNPIDRVGLNADRVLE